MGTGTQLAGRAAFAAVGLAVFVAISERGQLVRGFRSIGGIGLAIAALLSISSGSFIVALNHATVANVLFIQALSPIIAAILGIMFLGEHLPRRTWGAMMFAVAGVAVLVGGPGARPNVLGEGLALLMCVAFAVMLVLTRLRRDVSMVPATCLSQIIVFAAAAPFADPRGIDARTLALIAILGVGQLALGFVLLNFGARLVPAGEVGLITLLEIAVGPLWVWLALSETPTAITLIGGSMIIAAVAAQALFDVRQATSSTM